MIINDSLRVQLHKAIKENRIKIRYPKGYKEWKTKFDYFYNITKDVNQTLTIIYGPEGSAADYKGSLYNNSNFNIKDIKKKRTKPKNKALKHSSVFNYLRSKQNGTH